MSPVDNTLYDRLASSWWDEQGVLYAIGALNPARFGYMRRVLTEHLRLDPARLRVLDVGCGGGLLAEEFARLGSRVTGVDPSAESLATARAHAGEQGLSIDYHQASGEALPFGAGEFDAVYCCDVLEHVADLEAVVAEAARVLRPGGVYLFDTINRTLRSRLLVIGALQQWHATRLMPPDLHDWRKFIRPDELRAVLVRHALLPAEFTGLAPRVGLLRILHALRERKRGRLSYRQTLDAMEIAESGDASIQYLGYALKPT